MRQTTTLDGVEYAPGGKFRVVKEGARLSGWTPMAPSAWSGWSQVLHVGDVIECRGFGPGFGSDPGYGVEWTSEQAREAHAGSCDFWPSVGGMWSYHPAAGFLEPVDEEEEA
jgi:hypothetical protein